MRILILTHGRSGGLSLSRWISEELNLELFHEPFIQMDDSEYIKDNVFIKDNIVVKEFPFNIELKGYNVYDFIKTYDKLILHKRENLRDVAISQVSGSKRNNKDTIKIKSAWHEVYTIDDVWVESHKNEIIIQENEILERDSFLFKLYNNDDIKGLRTTYEGIYKTTNDISMLIDYLEVKKPVWLDILNDRHKLKNGTTGMSHYQQLKKLI